MSIQSDLMPGERIVARVGTTVAGAMAPALGTVVIAVVVAMALIPSLGAGAVVVLALFLLVTVVAVVQGLLELKGNEFTLTNQRVITTTGVVNRRSVEIGLSKVEGIAVEEPFVGRLLGYGSVVVSGTGTGAAAFTKIADPQVIRNAVRDEVERVQRGAR